MWASAVLSKHEEKKEGNSDFTHNRISFKRVMRFSLRIEKRGSFAARQFDELALLLEYTSFLILTKVYAASCLEDAGQSNRTQQTTPVFYPHFTFLFPIDAILFL